MTIDYQAAAIAAMKSAPLGGVEPKSEPVTLPTDNSEPADLDESKLVVDPVDDPVDDPVEEKPAEAKPAVAKKSLSDIAREKAEARKVKEAARPSNTLEGRLGPQGMHQLAQALEKNDTAAILRTLGVKPGDVDFQEIKEKIAENSATPLSPEVAELKQELEAIKAERAAEKYRVGHAKTLEVVKSLAADEEFALISDDHEAMDEALTIVEDFIKEHGVWPAETREESIKLGLREVNAKVQKEAARWEKVLTKLKKPAIDVPDDSSGQSSRAVSDVASYMTNKTLPAPAQKVTPPKSAEDYQAQALAGLRKMSK